MATILREALNSQGMQLTIFCGGQSYVGLNVSGTWAGLINWSGSFDGIKFFPLSVTPFPSGATVQSVTGNGNSFVPVQNYVAVRATLTTLTSGSAVVTMAASIDSSYQDAFLGATSLFVNQETSGGLTNVVTIAAQANRAWRCRTLSVGFSVAAGAAVALTISDGSSGVIWKGYVPANPEATGTSGGTFLVPLPADSNVPGVSGGGVVGTVGNSMIITLGAPGGSVVSEVNAEMIPA